jgi:hypothetical protein
MAATCYLEASGFGYQQVGPPGQLNWTIRYVICDPVTNELQLCDSSADYAGQIEGIADCPATQAGVIAASEAAVQAAETSYPGLVFITLAP